ncbi:MerR family transcriptional regulator [Parasalinivibrio latis]|uniref:MerR family transcriptional regulator n=1 Tax=Parasalinivibrio latis TaxID=2952610 RepID=UPI0030E5B9A5
MASEGKTYTISEVSELTGVNPVTLRAWQRRYGLVKPGRSEKGHRLYSDADLAVVQKVVNWLDKGVSIGKVKPLLSGDLTEPEPSKTLAEYTEITAALGAFRRAKVEQIVARCLKEYPWRTVKTKLVEPVENYLSSEGLTLADIQTALWRSVMVERVVQIVVLKKQQAKRRAVVCSTDDQTSYFLWLLALDVSSDGFGVEVLDGPIEKLNVLGGLLAERRIEQLVVSGDKKLTTNQINELIELGNQEVPVLKVTGDIVRIHRHELERFSERGGSL